MATNKKSFILYADWEELFETLTDTQAANLIRHIYRYVNDRNPELEDKSILPIWTLIKPRLKADLEKWEAQVEQRREAGKASAESRKRKSTSVNETVRKSTDNVNVNVNDSVSVSENVNDNDKLINAFKNSDSFFNQLKMKYRLEEKVFNNHLELFISMVELEKYNLSSLRTYFNNWLNSQLKNAPVKTKSGLNMNNPIL